MKSLRLPAVAGLALMVGACGSASARGIVWNESVNGDLSGDRFNPTNLTLHAGSNTLIATSGNATLPNGDREYVHFTLPAGTSLVGLVNVSYVGTGDDTAFIAVQAGSTFTEPPTGTTVGNILGYHHFGPNEGTIGLDILPDMGNAFAAIGFTPPLTGSNYTFWIQQVGSPCTYEFNFQVVPTPGTAGLVAAAGVVLLRSRRR